MLWVRDSSLAIQFQPRTLQGVGAINREHRHAFAAVQAMATALGCARRELQYALGMIGALWQFVSPPNVDISLPENVSVTGGFRKPLRLVADNCFRRLHLLQNV